MALRPEQLALSQQELREVEMIEGFIDNELLRVFQVAQKEYRIYLKLFPDMAKTSRVFAELIRRYKAAGWLTVEIDSQLAVLGF